MTDSLRLPPGAFITGELRFPCRQLLDNSDACGRVVRLRITEPMDAWEIAARLDELHGLCDECRPAYLRSLRPDD
jgi:hypothetical protein